MRPHERAAGFTDVDSAALDVMGRVGGSFLTRLFTAADISGWFASAMASRHFVIERGRRAPRERDHGLPAPDPSHDAPSSG